MANSRFASLGRYAAVLVAASLLATVSLDAAAYGDLGRIRLQLGTTTNGLHVPDRFVYEDVASAVAASSTDQTAWQAFGPSSKGCLLSWTTGYPQYAHLVSLVSSSAGGVPGLGPTSLGVFDGSQGTSCYRVGFGETLTLGLDTAALATQPFIAKQLSSGPSYTTGIAFDRLELDVEVKQNAAIQLDVYLLGQKVRSYYLRSGGSIVAGQGTIGESDPQHTVYNCNAQSDSGPDAGPLDNCHWIINDVGQSFTVTALTGQFSLEGGGDYTGTEYAHNSIIYLTSVVQGTLACGATTPTVESQTSGQSCTVTRLNPGSGCSTTINYILRAGEQSCEMISDTSNQLVANLFVQYKPEAAPAGKLPTSGWVPAGLSEVSFGNDPSGQSYPIPPCLGVTLTSSSGETPPFYAASVGPDPIPEIKNSNGVYDWVPGNSTIEYACAFQRTETYFGTPPALQNYIQEGIQFWGDIAFSRN